MYILTTIRKLVRGWLVFPRKLQLIVVPETLSYDHQKGNTFCWINSYVDLSTQSIVHTVWNAYFCVGCADRALLIAILATLLPDVS